MSSLYINPCSSKAYVYYIIILICKDKNNSWGLDDRPLHGNRMDQITPFDEVAGYFHKDPFQWQHQLL